MASTVMVTSNPDPARLESLDVSSWPTWGCGVSTFPWSYDEQETCLLLDWDVTVTPDGDEPVVFAHARPLWLMAPARVTAMQPPSQPTPPRPTPRESTEAMVRNILRELAEIEQAIDGCRGDLVAEPRLTGTWMGHLLISSNALLHNLLIESVRRPPRLSGLG